MKKLPILKPGDRVEIIAPASRCADHELLSLKTLLESWELNCVIPDDLFGKDLLCANTDEVRFKHLKNALQNPDTKAIICARGGYGSLRLIPELQKVTPPESVKLFVGMSDTTALQLYFQKKWQWPTVHGALAQARFSADSIAGVKTILFGERQQIEFNGLTALNKAAEKEQIIASDIIGGNLCLIQTGIGTIWQLEGKRKIILIEEIGERGYRVDRMLEQLFQANVFQDAAAILVGDFINGKEVDGSSLVEPVLDRFAQRCEIPVVRIPGVGHANTNFPIPLGTPATLHLGKELKLICTR